MKANKEKSTFREYAESLIVALLLALLMRYFVVQAFKIPSGSMETTLLIGDHILVNKFLYRFTNPERFDVIVFKYPWDDERDFIKRVIALPGDRVEMHQQQVSINGQPLDDNRYTHYAFSNSQREQFGPVIVPKKGDTVEIRRDGQLYLNQEVVAIPRGTFDPIDQGPVKNGFEVFYGRLFPPGTTLQKPTGPIQVDANYYFALGDNRDNSKDSRYWGFVKDDLIKGKAFFIYWSWNRQGAALHYVRWDRLGKLLQLPALSRVQGE